LLAQRSRVDVPAGGLNAYRHLNMDSNKTGSTTQGNKDASPKRQDEHHTCRIANTQMCLQ
ncbi:MAG: hypothetical protein ACE5KV_07155, partial [Thermoplasmata archaeon]